SSAPPDIAIVPAREAMTAEIRPALLLLLAAVALLLATATANVAGLQLARATTRWRELAVRGAIGAGRGRLIRQMIVESSRLGLAGSAVGCILAWTLLRTLPALLPADFPRVAEIGLQWPVIAFAVVMAMATSVGCGLLPAVAGSRVDLAET